MRLALATLFGLLSTPALAQDGEALWQTANQAMLLDALNGNAMESQARYEQLLHDDISSDTEVLADALFWLAQNRYVLKDMEGAAEALDRCVRLTNLSQHCLDEQMRISLEANSITSIPQVWEFDNTTHGVFHPRERWQQGSIRMSTLPGSSEGSGLLWTSKVLAEPNDKIIIGFGRMPTAPNSLRLHAVSETMFTQLRLIAETRSGHQYTPESPVRGLPKGEWVDMTWSLAELSPVSEDAPPYEASELYRVFLIEETPPDGENRENKLWIDRLNID